MDLASGVAPERGWSGTLELELGRRDERTVLERRSHRGPLQVQRVFHPEGPATAHVYVLHPPGGVVGGDELTVRAKVSAGAHALLTTPAATKLYRSPAKLARVENVLHVRTGAILEWLPGETLAFSGAHAELSTRVELEPGGVFMGWEILGLGRPAAGERFTAGKLTQRFELWRGAEPLFIERGRYDAAGAVLDQRWGLGGHSTCATFAAWPAGETLLEAVRDGVTAEGGAVFAATLVGQVLVVRALASGTAEARSALSAAWRVIRPELVGLAACEPRVWKT
jgi:urease accessory protein